MRDISYPNKRYRIRQVVSASQLPTREIQSTRMRDGVMGNPKWEKWATRLRNMCRGYLNWRYRLLELEVWATRIRGIDCPN